MITCNVETITPEMAKHFLTENKSNRKIRKTSVADYARAMNKNKWVVNNSGIGFSEKGRLIDGQHRLYACIESGVSFQAIVVRGLPEEERGIIIQETIDRGIVRNVGDTLTMTRGIPNAGMVAAIANILSCIFVGSWTKASTHNVNEIYNLYKNEMDYFCGNLKYIARLKNAPALAGFVIAGKKNMKEAAKFYEGYWTGEKLEIGSPIMALRNMLLLSKRSTTGGTKRLEITLLTLHALKKYFSNETVRTLRMADSTTLPFFEKSQQEEIKTIKGLYKLTI